ncbi:MAG: hypothetical protein LUD18_03875 [Lachnospiraceae bacterium]|nr:hypothetical protein [Lachnospiraceae bacterium]
MGKNMESKNCHGLSARGDGSDMLPAEMQGKNDGKKNSWPMASEYLGRICGTKQSIDSKQVELKSCQDLLESIQSCGFEEHFNASRNTDPPFVIYMNKVVDLEVEIENDIAALANMKCKAAQMIDRLPSRNERVVLRYRYLMLQPWRTVAERMGCSKRWALRIHDQAMENFEKILQEEMDSEN